MRNVPRIEYTPFFEKQRKAAPIAIRKAFLETLELFAEDPTHERLRNHPLTGTYAGYRSIDITPDWRAVFIILKSATRTIIRFHFLGTHQQLYGK
jgi:addiction module RelE/StbE family toxin